MDFGPGPAIVAGMGLDLDRLPTDPVLLSKILQEMAGVLEQERAELTAAKATMQAQTLQIEKLEHRVAWLLRVQFGRSREKMNIAQLRLMFDEVDIPEAANDDVPAVVTPKSARKAGRRNWLFIGSIEGGDASALFYSLVETCLCRARHTAVYAERRTMPSAAGWRRRSKWLRGIRMIGTRHSLVIKEHSKTQAIGRRPEIAWPFCVPKA